MESDPPSEAWVSPKAYAQGVSAGWGYGKSGQFASRKPANPFRTVTDAAKAWERGLQDGLLDFNADFLSDNRDLRRQKTINGG